VRATASFDIFVDAPPVLAGAGELCVSRVGTRNVVSRARATSPLKLLTPRNHGRAAWVFTSTYGGGLVDGDAITLDVEIQAGASALVSTQASTKVYRSAQGVSTLLRSRVHAGGLLVLLPDPVVCFAQSTYHQTQQFDLATDASLVCLDWMTSGRRASGERWAFDRYRTRLAIRVDGRAVCYDAVTLAAADQPLGERFGRFDVLATLAIVGPMFRDVSERLIARAAGRPIERHPDTVMAVSPLAEAGALIRLAGRAVEDVGRTLRDCLDFLPAVLGDDPWTRKW